MAEFSSEKIKELLSDPKNIELIAGIAGSMGAGGLPLAGLLSNNKAGAEQQNHQPQSFAEKGTEPEPALEESALAAVQSTSVPVKETSSFDAGLFQQGFPVLKANDSDRRIALLKAIKPYISDSKKERVDGLMRAISVAGILNNYKGGLFGNKM